MIKIKSFLEYYYILLNLCYVLPVSWAIFFFPLRSDPLLLSSDMLFLAGPGTGVFEPT